MANTTKELSQKDYQQVLRGAFNDADKSLSTSGFLTGKIGHKITRTLVDPVTEDYSFYDSDTLLYTYRVIYETSDLATLVSAERIA